MAQQQTNDIKENETYRNGGSNQRSMKAAGKSEDKEEL